MRSWFTASEIAGLKLPELPASKRGVLDYAARQGWMDRPGLVRQGARRNGAVEFHVDLLPPAARAALNTAAIAKVAASDDLTARAAREPEAARLTAPAAENRDARLAVLAAIDRFRQEGGHSVTTADALFIARYNLAKVEVDAWIRQALPELATRTVHRWRAEVKNGTLHRLAVDPGAKRRGKGMLEAPKVREFCLGMMALNPHHGVADLVGLLRKRFPTMKLPADRTMRLAMSTWKVRYKVELSRITNPDEFKNKYRPAGTKSHEVSRLNELWMIDASPADILTKDGRYAVYVCIDIFSRRLMIYVTKTARAEAVGLLMRRAILAWGVPERVKTDNGSDFTAKRTVRLLANLGIEVSLSTAFSPWEKGHIERAIGTMQRGCMAILPGFIGHNVADRKRIEERRAFADRLGESDDAVMCVELTPAELQTYVDDWAVGRYGTKPHDGLHGVTPQAAAAGYVGTRKTVDVHALDMLLAAPASGDGTRVVSKRGVRIDGEFYMTPTVLPDTRVQVRMDPADLGRAWLFSEDGEEFLGEAECPELAGSNPAEVLAKTKALHAQMLKDGTAAIRREMKTLTQRDVADILMRQGLEAEGKLVAFPRPSVAHTTPALEAAAEAAAARAAEPAPTPAPIASPAPASDFADAPNVQRLRPVETPQQRFRRAMGVEEAVAAGTAVEAAELIWLGGYQLGSEYRTLKDLVEDFGADEALR